MLLPALAGCPVFQSQNTPVDQFRDTEPVTGTKYWAYVPSWYRDDRPWPLVITLHGTYGFDSSDAQIKEWKALAEKRGFIVAAPQLQSVQGVLPVPEDWRRDDLKADEQAILSLREHMLRTYNIHPRAVLLTGFSAGGYPMYYTGLRNPETFSALVARGCNSEPEMFADIPLTEAAKNLPIIIIHGKDDLGPVGRQSWAMFRYLRENECYATEHYKVRGGHIRQPEAAWKYWKPHVPPKALR